MTSISVGKLARHRWIRPNVGNPSHFLGIHPQGFDSSGSYWCDVEFTPDDRCHACSEDFYGVQHLLMRKRRDTHLKCDSRDPTENFIYIQDFFRDRFSLADQQSAGWPAQGVELCARVGWPAAFFADFGKGVRIAWKEYVRGFFCGRCEKAYGMEAHRKLLGRMTGAATSLAVDVNEWSEAFRFAADDCHHKRKSEHTRANEGFGSPADTY